jgi:hypothetical protein
MQGFRWASTCAGWAQRVDRRMMGSEREQVEWRIQGCVHAPDREGDLRRR